MHFKRKVFEGKLSEIAGKKTLDMDILFRSLKLEKNAIKKYENSSEKTKQILQAYSNGINDYVDSLSILPLEFLLTGEKFHKWMPYHSYALVNLMAFFMSLDIVFEPFRHLLHEKYGEELSLEMVAGRNKYNFEMTTILDDNDLIKMGLFDKFKEQNKLDDSYIHLEKDYLQQFISLDIVNMLDNVVKGIQGSNSWVVHGNHTKSGKPILANDPHLETTIPSTWYQAEYIWKDENESNKYLKGVTLPGIPFIMIGRNKYAGWGITNNICDNSDFYVETIRNNSEYLFNNQWLPLKSNIESIYIKGEKNLFNFTNLETHHGPIIRGLFHLLDPQNWQQFDHLVSLSWIGFLENDQIFEGLTQLQEVDSIEKIEKSNSLISSPSLNLIWATTDNHIGYYAQGKLPKRNFQGNVYMKNGTNPYNDWIGYYSETEQPRVIDPEKGFIVTANNKMATDNLIHNINKAQFSISRAKRITDILQEKINQNKKLTSQDMKQIQLDVYDVYACHIVKPFAEIFIKKGIQYLKDENIYNEYKNYINEVSQWDCKATKGSISAGIFLAWEHFYLRTYINEVTDNEETRIIMSMSLMFDHFYIQEILRMHKSLDQSYIKSYCIVKDFNPEGDCFKNIIVAFDQAIKHLKGKYGTDIQQWSWGKIHQHRFDHKPFSQSPLKWFFERSYIGEGNKRTVNVGGVNHIPDKWDSWYTANYRMIIDFGNEEESFWVIDTGASENVFSQHYDDQMNLHEKGTYLKMQFTEDNHSFDNQQTILFQ